MYLDLKSIFVGREMELSQLNRLWKSIQNNDEHQVYIYLNTPGIGKTTLIKRFGEIIKSNQGGLHFSYRSKKFNRRYNFVKNLMINLQDLILSNTDLIENYLLKKRE